MKNNPTTTIITGASHTGKTMLAEKKANSSVIEERLDDTCCTIDNLKKDNHAYMEGCQKNGERIVLIDSEYNHTIDELLSL